MSMSKKSFTFTGPQRATIQLKNVTQIKTNNKLTGNNKSWYNFGLDKRILSAITRLGFYEPTPIQRETISAILSGKDVLGRAKTGSGKTAAYAIPAVQHILEQQAAMRNQSNNNSKISGKGIKCAFLVPTQELAVQVYMVLKDITQFCRDEICCFLIQTSNEIVKQDEEELARKASIVISTPRDLLLNAQYGSKAFTDIKQTLEMLIIDEADMMLSVDTFSTRDQNKNNSNVVYLTAAAVKSLVLDYLPSFCQCVMMSATVSGFKFKSAMFYNSTNAMNAAKELESFIFGKLLKSPLIIEIGDDSLSSSAEKAELAQYKINTLGANSSEDSTMDKLVYLYYLLKYKFYGGKVLIFINSHEKTSETVYAVNHALRTMGYSKCAAVTSDYPLLSRLDIMKQFNSGKINILVTTDQCIQQTMARKSTAKKSNLMGKNDIMSKVKAMDDSVNKNEMFEMSRGIDFKFVAAVINFDVPNNPEIYVHRVGRTARGGNLGVAVTLLSYDEEKNRAEKDLWDDVIKYMYNAEFKDTPSYDRELPIPEMEKALKIQQYSDIEIDEVDATRYRILDFYRVIKDKVNEIRISSIRSEMKNAEKLKNALLSADEVNHCTVGETVYDDVPDYLIAKSTKDQHLSKTTLLSGQKTQANSNLNELVTAKLKKKQKQVDPLYVGDKTDRQKQIKKMKAEKERKKEFQQLVKHKRDMGVDLIEERSRKKQRLEDQTEQ